ncbi:MAG: hypothetical protein JEZ07_12550 [Phycisphaerae bacterium]|nr:hypothetical protein [Phycisphaerae bacterium]
MKNKTSTIIIASLAGLILAGSVTACILYFNSNQPEKDAPVEEKVNYLASEDFGKLSSEKKRDYIETIKPEKEEQNRDAGREYFESLDEDQQIQLMTNMMQAFKPMIEKEIDKFEKMPQAEQDALVNKIIDGIVDRRKKNPNDPRHDRMKNISPKMMNALLENTNPEMRAHLNNFKKKLNKKLIENNLEPIPD